MTPRFPLRVEADHARRWPGADKLATECIVNLIRTQSLVVTELDTVFRRHGLTGPGFNVLMILDGAGEPLSPHVIGDRRLVTRGTVTGLLDTLEKQGLVRRTSHPGDRRKLLVECTSKAKRLLQRVCGELFPLQAEVMAGLSREDKATLVHLLGRLQEHLDEWRQTPSSSVKGLRSR